MARTEDIEAKLAAYVDGDIDEADRAEIEKHLAGNPQHRQLIEQLVRQRQLLAGLPREPAPADVADEINAQLERAALLGDVNEEVEAATLRISRWPQIRAIAAVLVLTGGLAAAIYYLLPSPNRNPEIVSIKQLPTPPGAPAIDSDFPADHAGTLETAEGISRMKSAADEAVAAAPAGAGGPSPAPAGSTGSGPRPERYGKGAEAFAASEQERRAVGALAGDGREPAGDASKTFTNVASPGQGMFAEVVTQQMKYSGAPAPAAEPLVVVIPTRNPAATNREVTQYLRDNGIAWASQAEPMPDSLTIDPADQHVMASRTQQAQVQLKSASPSSLGVPAAPDRGADTAIEQQLPSQQLHSQQPGYFGTGQSQRAAPHGEAVHDTLAAIRDRGQSVSPTSAQQTIVISRVPRHQAALLENALKDMRERNLRDGASDGAGGSLPPSTAPVAASAIEDKRQFPFAAAMPTTAEARSDAFPGQSAGSHAGGPMVQVPATQQASSAPAMQTSQRPAELGMKTGSPGEPLSAGSAEPGPPATAPALTPPMDIAAAAPATMPLREHRIGVGDTLEVVVPQLENAPGIDAKSAQTIGVDGTLTLPMLEPFPVLGMSQAELSRAIAERYRDARLIPDAAPRISLRPRTAVQQVASAALQTLEQPKGEAQALPPATQSADEQADLVDVVIVVQPEAPAALSEPASSAPGVQPAPAQPQPAPAATLPAPATAPSE